MTGRLLPIALCALFLPACLAPELDLSHLSEPVLLGDRACVGQGVTGAAVEDAGPYKAEIVEYYSFGLNLYEAKKENSAEAVAFEAIGGTKSYIGDVTVRVRSWGMNWLVLFAEEIDLYPMGTIKAAKP